MTGGSRYVVGIDLGTTNTAVAYVDTTVEDGSIQQLAIEQVIAPGEIAERSSLPSFLLLASEHEVSRDSLRLPWDEAPGAAVGVFARDRGAELPHRVVASAKSWLSHTGADRKAPILPWRGTDAEGVGTDAERVSPVEASARYLRHVRAAWNHRMEVPLEEQEVLLAVPASFDAVARELTVEAARAAGLEHITLIEEPQAAFYAWLADAGDGWRDRLGAGDVVLVCDVGGGTTDFTLIEVVDEGGNLGLERVAVGEHILLGGDNMDLALAYAVTAKLGDKGKQLKPMQRRALVHACRRAKEELLDEDAPESVPIAILGTGSKLIGGTVKTTLERADVEALIDGFFPAVGVDARPQARRAVGLKELGLPYAHDPAVTRHLAAFMSRHGKRPTAILWNGGVMKGTMLRGRVAQNLSQWYDGDKLPTLGETDLDLAVSNGAAYYGLVRRGRGIRIRGGTARAYYIGVESAMPAIPGFEPPIKGLCVAPFGMEEGTSAELPDEELGLVVGETAVFRLFAATHRHDDPVGAVVDPDEAELRELDPVETEMPAEGGAREGDVVPVSLQSKVTEIGTLELWCVARDDSGRRWKLEYSVREHD